MKKILFLSLFSLVSFCMIANDFTSPALQGLQGKNGELYFEMSGYGIRVFSYKGKISSSKDIAKVKKKYKIQNIQAEYSDDQIGIQNAIIEYQSSLANNPEVILNEVFFLLQKAENEMTIIHFNTLNQRDIILEQDFVKAYLNDSLTDYISKDWNVETVSFAGKTIQLGNACGWRSPHNLYCKGGQISWSEFSSYETANLDLDARIAANNSPDYSILSEEDIDILFDGIPTVAYRIAYLSEKDYYRTPLIVYYVVTELRGRYISCTMSNYGYNRNDYELSPLLEQFMSIPEKPEWAYNSLDVPQYEDFTEKQQERIDNQTPLWELRLGTLLPLGNLKNRYTVAPSIELFVGFPFGEKRNMAIDLGVQIGIPVQAKKFDYYYEKNRRETDPTKATLLPRVNLRYRYQKTLSPNIFSTIYLGAGYGTLTTNLEDGVSSDGNKTYYEVGALNVYGGGSIRYKRIGCFVEYQYNPYNFSYKVDTNFGSSALNIGAFFAF